MKKIFLGLLAIGMITSFSAFAGNGKKSKSKKKAKTECNKKNCCPVTACDKTKCIPMPGCGK
jgi:hypothetical protein